MTGKPEPNLPEMAHDQYRQELLNAYLEGFQAAIRSLQAAFETISEKE